MERRIVSKISNLLREFDYEVTNQVLVHSNSPVFSMTENMGRLPCKL